MIETSWIRIWIEAGWADKMTFGIPVKLMDAYLPVCYCPVKKVDQALSRAYTGEGLFL